jgi:hypothetical protein
VRDRAASIAAGVAVAERFGGARSKRTGGSFALRPSATRSVTLGDVLFAEHAGYRATIDLSESRTPLLLDSETKVLVLPYLGLQFGP